MGMIWFNKIASVPSSWRIWNGCFSSLVFWTCQVPTCHRWCSCHIKRRTLDIQGTLLFTDRVPRPSLQGLKGAQLWQLLGSKWLKTTTAEMKPRRWYSGGESTKTAVPIPFTKKLSFRPMMRVTGFCFYLFFFPRGCFKALFSVFESIVITIFELVQNSFLFFLFLRRFWQLAQHLGKRCVLCERRPGEMHYQVLARHTSHWKFTA